MSDAYSSTAFDSSRPRKLPSHSRAGWTVTDGPQLIERLPWGIYFGDFVSFHIPRIYWFFAGRVTHEGFHLLGPRFDAIPILLIITIPLLLIGMVTNAILMVNGSGISMLYFFIPPGLILLYAAKQDLKPSRITTTLSRRKGTVWFAGNHTAQEEEFPFDEFDAYLSRMRVGRHGQTVYTLNLVHRYSGRRKGVYTRDDWRETYRFWEMLQQYMDISRPLPDIRVMEPLREFDPTTVLYDNEIRRPKNYWASGQHWTGESRHEDWRKCAMKFPWRDLPNNTDPYSGMQTADLWRRSTLGQSGTLCDSVLLNDED